MNQESQNLGGKHKKTARKKTGKRVIHVGKIFADWCGHCQTLKPEWEKMKKNIQLQLGRVLHNVHVRFVEIGDTEQNKSKGLTVDGMTEQFNSENGCTPVLKSDGYPTLFKVVDGKLEYYSGERNADAMYNWYMQGAFKQGGSGKKTAKKRTKRGILSGMSKLFKFRPFYT